MAGFSVEYHSLLIAPSLATPSTARLQDCCWSDASSQEPPKVEDATLMCAQLRYSERKISKQGLALAYGTHSVRIRKQAFCHVTLSTLSLFARNEKCLAFINNNHDKVWLRLMYVYTRNTIFALTREARVKGFSHYHSFFL